MAVRGHPRVTRGIYRGRLHKTTQPQLLTTIVNKAPLSFAIVTQKFAMAAKKAAATAPVNKAAPKKKAALEKKAAPK